MTDRKGGGKRDGNGTPNVADFVAMLDDDPEAAIAAIGHEATRLELKFSRSRKLAGLDEAEVIAGTTERLWMNDWQILRQFVPECSLTAAIAGVMRNIVRELRRAAAPRAAEIDLASLVADVRSDSRRTGASAELDSEIGSAGPPLERKLTAKQWGAIRSVESTGSFERSAKKLGITIRALKSRLDRARGQATHPPIPESGFQRIEFPDVRLATFRRMPQRWKRLCRLAKNGFTRKQIAHSLKWSAETTHREIKDLRKWLLGNE